MPFPFFCNRKKNAFNKEILGLNQEIFSLKDQSKKDRNVLEEKCTKIKEECTKIKMELRVTRLQLTRQKAETKQLQQARDKAFQSQEEEHTCKASLKQDLDLKNKTIQDLKEQLEHFVQELNSQNVLLTKYKKEKRRLLLSNYSLSQKLCVKDEHILKKNAELSDVYLKMESLEERLASERHPHEKQMEELEEMEHQGKILKERDDELLEKQATIAQLTKDLEEREFLVQTLQELSKTHKKTKEIEEVMNEQEKERTFLMTQLLKQTVREENEEEKEEALRINKELATEIKEKETSLQSVLQAAEELKSSLQYKRNGRNNLAHPRLPKEVLLAIGGWRGDSSTNIIESYDNHAGRWVGMANFDETPRRFHGTVFLHGSVYLIGGSDGVYDLCTTHKHDLANHTWRKVAPMNKQRNHVSVALLDGFIYAMGGLSGQQRLNTAEKYFPDANQWTMIAPMNEKRSNASSTACNRNIYICGGFNGVCLSTAECYNPLTNQWTIISAMSSRRSGVGVIAYFNEIYVLGGYDGEDYLNIVEAYNPNTNTWHPLPPMLKSRSLFGIGVFEDKLYAVGGFNGFKMINYVESFDVKTRLWSPERNMNVSRYGLSCSVVYDLPNMADYSAAHSSPPEE